MLSFFFFFAVDVITNVTFRTDTEC